MKCPNCNKDDSLWIISGDKITHLTCNYTLKNEEMLDFVRKNHTASNS